MKTTDKPIIVEQAFSCSVSRVWNAITRLEQMKQWFFENIEDFKPELGFKTQFVVQVEDRRFTHLWEITEVIPNKRIVYRWKYAEYPGDSFVTFELIEKENQVNLKIISKVIEDFPENIPEFLRESGIQGWRYFIQKRLKNYLEDN